MGDGRWSKMTMVNLSRQSRLEQLSERVSAPPEDDLDRPLPRIKLRLSSSPSVEVSLPSPDPPPLSPAANCTDVLANLRRLQTQAQSTLKVENDQYEPYFGVLDDQDAANAENVPTSEDMALFRRYADPIEPIDTKSIDLEAGQNLSRISKIRIGNHEIGTWYSAPYPLEYTHLSTLHICDYCLKYCMSEFQLYRHRLKCSLHTPPGNEIYRHDQISVFEVDGAHAPIYCQNLCLVAKLFLNSKTLYYDVEPFVFYVLTETDEHGAHFVGYFSKQKTFCDIGSELPINNVSCIVTLPTLQRRGYGQFLISLSYLLTEQQDTTGTPEKPLSDLGLKTYTRYWKTQLCRVFKELHDKEEPLVSIKELSKKTRMTLDDVVFTLEQLGWLRNGKVEVDMATVDEVLEKWDALNYIQVDRRKLIWAPMYPRPIY